MEPQSVSILDTDTTNAANVRGMVKLLSPDARNRESARSSGDGLCSRAMADGRPLRPTTSES